MMDHYRLESFHDSGCRIPDARLSLSASSDEQAKEQAEAVRWRHECAGESRVLVLSRPSGDGWAEVARIGSRRHADA